MKKNLLPAIITLLLIHQQTLEARISPLISDKQNEELSIQLMDSTATDFCNDSLMCSGEATIYFEITGACLSGETTVTAEIDLFNDGESDGAVAVDGSFPDFSVTGTYDIGVHRFILNVEDGCGAVSVLNVVFRIVDCEIASPACISGLAVQLMPGDVFEIFATDFIPAGDTLSDCSGILGYSIHKRQEVLDGTDVPGYPHPSIVPVCCEDNAIIVVQIYVWDNAYNPYSVQPDGTAGGSNYAYCETFVLIQDWEGVCECFPGVSIHGHIETSSGEPMEGVLVSLTGSVTMDQLTDSLGNYRFDNISPGADIVITPYWDVDYLNGVSTFDLVLIAKHILGIQLLDDPYKMIAADVNNSASISTMDLIQLRKAILGIYTEFPSNTSWRFVDANYVFPGGNPFGETFPEVVGINNISEEELDVNFIGVKVGDVNESVQVD